MKTLIGLFVVLLICITSIVKAVADVPTDQKQLICMDYDVGITQMEVSVNADLSMGLFAETSENSFEFTYINNKAEISPYSFVCNCNNEQRYKQESNSNTIKRNLAGYPLKFPFRNKEKRA